MHLIAIAVEAALLRPYFMEEHQHHRQPSSAFRRQHDQYQNKTRYLEDEEINEFIRRFEGRIQDGPIRLCDLEDQFDLVYNQVAQQSPTSRTTTTEEDRNMRQRYLRSLLNVSGPEISRDDLFNCVRNWQIPSLRQVRKEEERQSNYFKRHNYWRMIRAYWNVHGHEVLLLSFVFAIIIGFAAWEIVKFKASRYISTFGYGVVVAKACTGALYPTFFFMMLSMSRYFTTMVRRSRHISRFFNLDLSMNFHIYMSCLGLLLATIHAASHLSGTFVQGSKPKNFNSAAEITGNKLPGRQYMDYIRSVPGFTGIVALGLFFIIALLSIPFVRRRNYNVFQVGHLLVYPITGFMMAHGTLALLQQPIFGYILAFPTFLVLFERLSRLFLTFYHIEASLEVLSDETVELTAVMPKYRLWDYTAGQYVLLQVPAISYFQWHPFTISYSSQKTMKLFIKTDGDWTSKLRDLGPKIQVGINGPFGAPAQRFNDFQNAVIIGAGIGVTPFSAILAELQQKSDLNTKRQEQQQNSLLSSGGSSKSTREAASPTKDVRTHATKRRRIDFHWIVRDHHYISWLSNLLNEISRSQMSNREPLRTSDLDIRISTHFTAKYGDIVTYIFSWLLEMSRTEDNPTSLLTGLLNDTYFGRPDFDKILEDHYERMRKTLSSENRLNGTSNRKEVKEGGSCRVGVFYCGAAEVGVVLADKCNELTFRGQNDGSKIEYYFMVEVF